MELTHQLAPMLRTLRLSGILETLDVRNRQAVEEQSSFVEFLTMLLHDEVERRAQSKLRLRLRRAAFDPTKTLEGFDFSFNPKLNKAQVFDLATGQFIERHESVLVYGPTGVGKSHLAQALAHEACRRGYEVLFVATDKMLVHLAGGRARVALAAQPQRGREGDYHRVRDPVPPPHWLRMGDPEWLSMGARCHFWTSQWPRGNRRRRRARSRQQHTSDKVSSSRAAATS